MSVDEPRSWNLLNLRKFGEYRPASKRNAAWRLAGESLTKNGKRGRAITANSLLGVADGGYSRLFRYSSITAADEKIPLSVVHVNKKPQYLVFSGHSGHLVAKHWELPVESSKQPCAAQSWGR
jgi:hypothetical protein